MESKLDISCVSVVFHLNFVSPTDLRDVIIVSNGFILLSTNLAFLNFANCKDLEMRYFR